MAATYAQDTAANQAVVDEMVNDLRSFCVELQALNKKYAGALANWFNGNPTGSTPSAIIGGYTAGSAIPNKSNLAGAEDVTNTAVQTVAGYLQTVNGLYDAAHLNVMTPFAGPTNV